MDSVAVNATQHAPNAAEVSAESSTNPFATDATHTEVLHANNVVTAAAAAAAPALIPNADRSSVVGLVNHVATALGVDVMVVFVAASTLAAVVLYRFVFRRVLAAVGLVDGAGAGGGGGGSNRRHTVLLLGLPSSGKTVLMQQLQAVDVNTGRVRPGLIAETRTSMQVNAEKVLGGRFTVVDYPGHRRLRGGLFPHLREAATVVVVIDAITVHDDRHEGAFAVAELLLSVLPSAEFYGVKRLLFICAKRDDLTAYSAKAVQKLLEKAMTASLQSQQGDLARVDAVVDAKGTVVGRGGKGSGRHGGRAGGRAGKRHVLELDENGSFDFEEQLGIPVHFVEVGCNVSGTAEVSDNISVTNVVDFLTSP